MYNMINIYYILGFMYFCILLHNLLSLSVKFINPMKYLFGDEKILFYINMYIYYIPSCLCLCI